MAVVVVERLELELVYGLSTIIQSDRCRGGGPGWGSVEV